MPWACLECGGHGDGRVVGARWVCRICGAERAAEIRPFRVVTGAAATGKSTLGAVLTAHPGIVALDVDIVADGAAAVTGQRDYVSFWTHLMSLAFEVHQSGVDTVWCGICRPEQLAAQSAELRARFASIELLVLSCDPATYPMRLGGRPGGSRAAGNAALHVPLNDELRAASSTSSVRVTHLDTTRSDVAESAAATRRWIAATASANPQLSSES